MRTQHDFRRAIVTSYHVFCQLSLKLLLSFFIVLNGSGESEVAHAYIALLCGKEVRRFDISVDDVCGMEEFKSFDYLVDNVLHMLIGEFLV